MSYRRPQQASPNAQLDMLVRQRNQVYSPPSEFSWDAIADDEKKDSSDNLFACTNPFPRKKHQSRRGRLAKLFSKQPPHSPAHSSSSSGFVGWPGTQDQNGQTVPSNSYDDSSLSKAEQEVSRWTNQTSACTTDDNLSLESFPSPIRKVSSRDSFPSPIRRTEEESYDDPDLDLPHHESFDSDVPHNAAEFHNFAARADSLSAMKYRRDTLQSPSIQKQALPRVRPLGRVRCQPSVQAQQRQQQRQQQQHNVPRVRSEPSRQLQRQAIPQQQTKAVARPQQTHPPELRNPVPLQRIKASLNQKKHDADPYKPYGARQSRDAAAAAAKALERTVPLSEEVLNNNSRYVQPPRNFATPASRGFAGLLNKTQDVPCLVDNLDSDSMSSSKATSASGSPSKRSRDLESISDIFDGLTVTNESDVFDNLSFGPSRISRQYPERIAEEEENFEPEFKLVHLPGGLTTIQTSPDSFRNRDTASDYDGNLTNSDISSNGYTRIPTFPEMQAAGTSYDSSLHGIHGNIGSRNNAPAPRPNPRHAPTRQDGYTSGGSHADTSSSSSLFSDPYRGEAAVDRVGDWSMYCVHPDEMKKVIKRYRRLSQKAEQSAELGFTDLEKEEDESKAFALFEMRSRIMEKDIERGLERRGGTSHVDDLVTTDYYRTSHRIRDAVIVSKAWRDGATITDVVNSALLTRRTKRSYFIRRPIVQIHGRSKSYRYTWEAVKWLDDTDMLQYRCTSLGSRHMRGFEMFTIGDCQSMLLKLTNERCVELRQELNDATARQLKAEELLKSEVDHGDGMMTDAEMAYLAAMEVVKTISKELVTAERSHALVRERIEKLIERYESLLRKIESDSFAGASSVFTNDSSYYSEYTTSEILEHEEKMWARRARRAEIEAEIAAREALMESHQSRRVRDEKLREVEALRQKLDDLQSESHARTEEDRFLVAQRLGAHRGNIATSKNQAQSLASSASQMSKAKLDGVKQRFRDRMASRNPQRVLARPAVKANRQPSPFAKVDREFLRSAGQEMMSQMDFYERSLQAVNRGQ